MSDVATAAGVSLQTVSRALNNSAKVRESTRKRILAAIEQVGYRPSFAGKSLRKGSYHCVGYCTPGLQTPGCALMLEGVMTAARQHGYAVTLVEFEDSLKEISDQLVSLPVDGIIIDIDEPTDDFDTFIRFPGINTVLLTSHAHPLCTTVEADQVALMRMAVDYLADHGHRRIRLVGWSPEATDFRVREQAMRDELDARGLPHLEPLCGGRTVYDGYRLGLKLVDDTEATAFLAVNDSVGLGIRHAFQERGVRVPGDKSLICIEYTPQQFSPVLTTTSVCYDLCEIGARAFEAAIEPSKESKSAQAILIGGHVIERGTVADIR